MRTATDAVAAPVNDLLSRNQSEDWQGVFVLKPMLQWGGQSNRQGAKRSLSLVWLSICGAKRWSVSSRLNERGAWQSVKVREVDSFSWKGAVCHRLQAKIDFESPVRSTRPGAGVRLDKELLYRLNLDGQTVFSSAARFPIAGSQRTVVFGDFADGSSGASDIAHLAHELQPNMVLLTGDIVYKSGLMQEYKLHYEPVFNDDAVPLARSTVVVAAAGNHDVRLPKLADQVKPSCDEDSFGYFRIFRQPNNGPRLSAARLRKMIAENAEGLELMRCIGPDFVRRANFAVYQGEAQWTVLDANKYMDWRDLELQAWLRKTLSRGQSYKWRFVSFHQPGFSDDAKYKTDMRMRVLAPIFEEFGVQLVFSGHCHFYQRHRPIQYRLNADASGRKRNPRGTVTVDVTFDGVTNCKPHGVIYIVSGAGGSLQEPDVRPSNFEPQPYSYKICDDRNSLTVLDFEDDSVVVRQLTADGQEVDRFTIRS
jgi:hypothetical protein